MPTGRRDTNPAPLPQRGGRLSVRGTRDVIALVADVAVSSRTRSPTSVSRPRPTRCAVVLMRCCVPRLSNPRDHRQTELRSVQASGACGDSGERVPLTVRCAACRTAPPSRRLGRICDEELLNSRGAVTCTTHPVHALIVDRDLTPAHLDDGRPRRAVLAGLRTRRTGERCHLRPGDDQDHGESGHGLPSSCSAPVFLTVCGDPTACDGRARVAYATCRNCS